jgi:hypothetical protein
MPSQKIATGGLNAQIPILTWGNPPLAMTIETFFVLAKVLLKKPGFTDTKKSHFLVGWVKRRGTQLSMLGSTTFHPTYKELKKPKKATHLIKWMAFFDLFNGAYGNRTHVQNSY